MQIALYIMGSVLIEIMENKASQMNTSHNLKLPIMSQTVDTNIFQDACFFFRSSKYLLNCSYRVSCVLFVRIQRDRVLGGFVTAHVRTQYIQ